MIYAMMRVVFTFLLLLVFYVFPVMAEDVNVKTQDKSGNLKPPKMLAGLWEREAGPNPELFLQFISDHEYRIVHGYTGVPVSYNTFRIFRITDKNLVYAIVKQVKNFHHYDGDVLLDNPETVHEMTAEEIKQASARYFYVLFDLSPDMYYYHHTVEDGYFRVFYDICSRYLRKKSIVLSQKDFDGPAADHWNYVRPGTCPYSDFANSGDRPEYDEDIIYGIWTWNNGNAPWDIK